MDALSIAGSGMTFSQTWLNALSFNIANVNTAMPTSGNAFQARYVVAQAGQDQTGVYASGVTQSDPAGILTYDPTSPVADAQGYVRLPDIDMGSQMTQLIMAQRGYQANANVVDRARDTYLAALQIGKNG